MLSYHTVSAEFERLFRSKPAVVVRAPGRVNLIGEHTDYNDGFVLPMALEHAIWIALRPRTDRRVMVYAQDMNDRAEFSLDGLERGHGWVEYLKGVAHVFQQAGYRLRGWEGVMMGDVPRGAGLSSSAAVEMATARAFSEVSGFVWEPLRMARLGQQAENEWVGVKCGIMDQAVSAAAQADHALFLDCRTLEYEPIPMPADVSVLVMDTSTRRGLVESAYNERRQQCEQAAHFFGVKALRDVRWQEFLERGRELPRVVWKRARHVITENERVLRAVAAMRANDPVTLGKLFNESHASLRNDFEVTNDALNWIVEIAQAQPACYGARMTGAGFGGCAVAVVRQEAAQAFMQAVKEAYRARSGLEASLFLSRAGQGAEVVQE